MDKNNKQNRPESYPRPTETDEQLKNQPEYMDQEPNEFNKSISDVPDQKERRDNTQQHQPDRTL
jgi:hypothetical protein